MKEPLKLCIIGNLANFVTPWFKEAGDISPFCVHDPQEALLCRWGIAVVDVSVYAPTELRALFQQGPVVAVVEQAKEELALEALELGARDYVLKEAPKRLPYTLKRLEASQYRRVFHDTELKRQEDELHILQQERIQALEEGDRIKDEFLSVISHELRTPLNSIMGFSSLLEDEACGPIPQEGHEFLARIMENANRMVRLIDDLLDVARLQAKRYPIIMGDFAYGPLVSDTLASLHPIAQKKAISMTHDVLVPRLVTIDGQRIAQVLSNLLTNAIKYTPEGGHIQVTARIENETLVTEVSDDGIGIAPKDLNKLFTPFRQLDMSYTRQVGGTGLGLSICKGILETHGGSIQVSSPGKGRGTTFRFAIPLS